MALRGDLEKITDLKKRLRALPTSLAHDVAQRGAPKLTQNTRQAFTSGNSVYGEQRPLSVDGNALTLRDTGTTERMLAFTASGSIIRAVLATKYGRYLVRYGILPNGRMPAGWSADLGALVKATNFEAL